MRRPSVSVIVPFLGDAREALSVVDRLLALRTQPGDELIVADNTANGTVAAIATDGVRVVAAAEEQSASYARNVGARAATAPWLLFTDADCLLPADVLDQYFGPEPDERSAIVAGEVEGSADQPGFLARWARSRRGRWVVHHQSWGPYPGGVTANMLVRRSAWQDVDGFRIGGGGDLDFCWRAQEAGWGFEYRPTVLVRHRDREGLGELISQGVSYGSHQRHLRALHGPSVPKPSLARPLGRSILGTAAWGLRGQPTRAAFKAVDGLWSAAVWWGWITSGRHARRAD